MIQPMPSPFRYNKKQRKYWRKSAKAHTASAAKLADEGTKREFVALSQQMADLSTKMSLTKRRKKKLKKST
jgi:hypothetical protein